VTGLLSLWRENRGQKTIVLGNERENYVEGQRNMDITIRVKTFMFKNVYYIPRISEIIFSISEITKHCPYLDMTS
jgi:hypothetical protein